MVQYTKGTEGKWAAMFFFFFNDCININCNVLKLFVFEKLSYLKGRKTDLPSVASQSQSWARLRPEASNWVFLLAGREPTRG